MGTLPSSGWQLVFMPSYALFFYQGEKDFGSKVWGQDCLYKQSHSQCDGQSHSLTSQHLPVAHCPTCPWVRIISPFPCSFILCIPVSNASTDSCSCTARTWKFPLEKFSQARRQEANATGCVMSSSWWSGILDWLPSVKCSRIKVQLSNKNTAFWHYSLLYSGNA